MKTAAVAFATSVATAAVLTPAIRRLANRRGCVDHALTSRKIHVKAIPRLGGVAIALAFYAPILGLLLVNSNVGGRFYAEPAKAFGLLIGGLGIAALGIYDDLKGANAKIKFVVQFGVAGLMYALGFRIDQVASPVGAPIELGFLAVPFTLLWIVGVINAMNLIDGLDGLAGGVALIAVTTTFIIAVGHADPLMVLTTAALAGAVLGFLFYNFNPASIFMGDTGSMFLGFVLATTAIRTNEQPTTAVAIVVPIIALGFPIADTLLAMARRAARGVPMFSGDRGHIHHRLLDLGLSHRNAVLVLYAVSVVLGLVALALAYGSASQAIYFLLALAGVGYLALRALGYFDLDKAPLLLEHRRRNMQALNGIRRVAGDLRAARSVEDVWVAARAAADALGASAIALHLPLARRGGEKSFSVGFDEPGELFRARYSLLVERPGDRHVELGWDDGRTRVERDTEIAIELLCDHLAVALERVTAANDSPLFAKVANLS